MTSYLSHLECTICAQTYPANQLAGVSPCCGKVLYARYDLDKVGREVDRDRLAARRGDMWRFAELLPVDDPQQIVSLGEGGTPLIRAANLQQRLGVSQLYIKEEGLNPTGTFKARGIAAAVSKALELGAPGLYYALGRQRRRRCRRLLRPGRPGRPRLYAPGRPGFQQERMPGGRFAA